MKKIIEYLFLFIKLILIYSISTLVFFIALSITLCILGYLLIETFINPSLGIIAIDCILIVGIFYLAKSVTFRNSIKELWLQIKWNK